MKEMIIILAPVLVLLIAQHIRVEHRLTSVEHKSDTIEKLVRSLFNPNNRNL